MKKLIILNLLFWFSYILGFTQNPVHPSKQKVTFSYFKRINFTPSPSNILVRIEGTGIYLVDIYNEIQINDTLENYIRNIDLNKIQTYPNPTHGLLNIVFQSPIENGKIEIYNLNGNLLLSKNIYQKEEILDLNNFPNNLYILRITKNQQIILTQKIIKI